MHISTISFLVFSCLYCFAQPLTDNLQLSSSTNFKINPGTYSFSDQAKDGVIQITNANNINIDGDSVIVDGIDTLGYMIKIENSHDITISNFEMVKRYHYAIYINNSYNITINNNELSLNNIDTIGWIVIFDGPDKAHGGGVFLDSCHHVEIFDNTMTEQNDGIAVYNSRRMDFHDNYLAWNQAYGIRMFYTDSSTIHNNNCSHVNRNATDPSDCAALLMMYSHENVVEHNDLSYSGDGVFLTEYQNLTVPSNNYFAYNECSYSPHNAIEATFAEGNVFKHNICNYSNYGLWLGFSNNTIVDSNEINYNSGIDGDGGGGIAIERGFNNTFTNNMVMYNSQGMKIWADNQIPPYSYVSKNYLIENNTFYGNRRGITSFETNNMNILGNEFTNNWNAIDLQADAEGDTIMNNTFNTTAAFFIENNSQWDVYAINNTMPDDTALINCKIYDKNDTASYGTVTYVPFNTSNSINYQTSPACDLTEEPGIWDAYYFVEDAAKTSISWDTNEKMFGDESLFVDSESGFDVTIHYFADKNRISTWQLEETDSIVFWMKINITDPTNVWGVQEAFIKIGNSCGASYKYSQEQFPHILSDAIDVWKRFAIPLSGNADWTRTKDGDISFDDISYVEINVDVWQWGFEYWIDGLTLPTKKPTAYFEHVIDDMDVDFTQFSCNALSWLWEFGDGNSSTNLDPSHTYPGSGTYIACLTVNNPSGSDSICTPISIGVTSAESNLKKDEEGSRIFKVNPNPFNNKTNIIFKLPSSDHVLVRIFDSVGHEVAILRNGMTGKGEQQIEFDPASYGLTSGIYFCQIRTSDFSMTRKMLLTK